MAQRHERPAKAPAQPPPQEAVKLAQLVKERLSGLEFSVDFSIDEVVIQAKAQELLPLSLRLKEEPALAFDYLRCVSVVEYPESFQVVYHLWSMAHQHKAVVKVDLPKEEPEVPSITPVYPSANWHEREGAELFGVVFQGHPNPKPLLLWEGFEGYPLRKDYPFYDYFAEEGIPAPQH